MKTFEELGVREDIRRAIEEMGFSQPMPVQEATIPFLLGEEQDAVEAEKDNAVEAEENIAGEEINVTEAEGSAAEAESNAVEAEKTTDLIALAQTGTGKTAAFGLPLVQSIDLQDRTTQAVVVAPTRELCLQIADDMRDFSKYIEGLHIVAVYGGASIENQMRSLRHGAQIIVATPGRLIDLKNRGYAKLENVKRIVLDEADEMLNMGFTDSINEIFESLPENHITLLFSATMSREIERIAKQYLKNYKEIVIGSRNEGAENVNHIYYLVNAKDKYLALKRVVDYYPRIYAIIFCRTKIETQEVADHLIRDGYNADSLHGDLSQQQRDLTMQKFRNHLIQLLVATDVAARGLDVDDLTHVINFSMPDDIESYTHRSGRTGRAGKKGTSIAIIHTRERHKIREVEKQIGKEFVDGTLPTPQEICTKQLFRAIDEIEKTDVDDEQIEPFMTEVRRHFEYVDKDDILKKMVSSVFGRFLKYYADAPEIVKPDVAKKRNDRKRDGEGGSRGRNGGRGRGGEGGSRGKGGENRGPRTPEKGYTRLFINLGKDDGFYPGEVMQFVNRHVEGRQNVGHIDLLPRFSYIEVPDRDAKKVIAGLDGTFYKGRQVRCNREDSKPSGDGSRRRSDGENGGSSRGRGGDSPRNGGDRQRRGGDSSRKGGDSPRRRSRHDDDIPMGGDWAGAWKGLVKDGDDQSRRRGKKELKGEQPDFSEEGWARRKPKKK